MNATAFVLFGLTGDLAKRKIIPALYNLFLSQKLPDDFFVVGIGRRELSESALNGLIEQSLSAFSRRQGDADSLSSFAKLFRYCPLDISSAEDYQKLFRLVQPAENRMFYLSVAPEHFAAAASNLKQSGVTETRGWKKLLIEKPFGRDLASARELNARLSELFQENEIYRIDHFLGKPMVQNLDVLVSRNPVLSALWDNRAVSNVQITASETVGVEERAAYYDASGALRDMIQNHLLQILMMTAMRVPIGADAETIRERKKDVLAAALPFLKEGVSKRVVLGQYKGYTDEPGVCASSKTETFVALRLVLDTDAWQRVPFYLRTGKKTGSKSTRVVVEFKHPFNKSAGANLLTIHIGPNEGFSLSLEMRDPITHELSPVLLERETSAPDEPEAYENLIFNAIRGDARFFAHWDEAELSWKLIQPILDATQEGKLEVHPYEKGTNGPAAASELLARDGNQWHEM